MAKFKVYHVDSRPERQPHTAGGGAAGESGRGAGSADAGAAGGHSAARGGRGRDHLRVPAGGGRRFSRRRRT